MHKLKKLFREPILLFLFLGTILFVLYTRATDYIDKKNKQVLVSQTQLALMGESFIKTWNRNPTETEFAAQVENFIMDEIFFKEAVAMGLDKTDPTIKRRLRQIMEMMLDDYTTIYPVESQLSKYLAEHPDKFRRDSRISFRHLYFPMEDKEKTIKLLSSLQKGMSVDENYTGNLLLIPSQFEDESKSQIKKLFGTDFTQNIFELEIGNWQGPVASSYGWHLVKVSQRIEGEVPDLNEIWDSVEQEWSFERKKEMKEEQNKVMREQYEIVMEDAEQKE